LASEGARAAEYLDSSLGERQGDLMILRCRTSILEIALVVQISDMPAVTGTRAVGRQRMTTMIWKSAATAFAASSTP
jgi:hypothetical protein